jgi:hypothetical protein
MSSPSSHKSEAENIMRLHRATGVPVSKSRQVLERWPSHRRQELLAAVEQQSDSGKAGDVTHYRVGTPRSRVFGAFKSRTPIWSLLSRMADDAAYFT